MGIVRRNVHQSRCPRRQVHALLLTGQSLFNTQPVLLLAERVLAEEDLDTLSQSFCCPKYYM